MRLLTTILVLGISSVAGANDGAIWGKGGSMRPMDGEHPSVRMVREWVHMDVYSKFYNVEATFVFHNKGSATVVKMGFPESAGGDASVDMNGFEYFETRVDGKRVQAQRIIDKSRSSSQQAYWIKQVRFAPGQTRRVDVRYRSVLGHSIGGPRSAEYRFFAGNWHDTVEQTSLVIRLHAPGPNLATADLGLPGKTVSPPLRQKGNRFAFTWRDWQAEGDFTFSFRSTAKGALKISDPSGFFSNSEDQYPYYLENPGKGTAKFTGEHPLSVADTVPPDPPPRAVLRDGVTFLNLRTLCGWLDFNAREDKSKKRAQLAWKAATRTATLRVGSLTLVFPLGEQRMEVSGSKDSGHRDVALSRPTFSINGSLYVPVADVFEVLGGTARLEAPKRLLHLTSPEWWKA